MRSVMWPQMKAKPYYENESVKLYHGNNLKLIEQLPAGSVDGMLTDPPYCSGTDTKSGRDQDPVEKYCKDGNACGRPSFEGDARDQRSFVFWLTLLYAEAYRACGPSSYAMSFIDWRMLASMIDVFQASGFTYKGLIPWNKGRSSRAPHRGYFRHQCEYVVWGTRGKVPRLVHAGPFDGQITQPVRQADKFHISGKPTAVLQQLVQPFTPGALILDPFAGSGTLGVAAMREGRRAILFEVSEEYCEVTAKRLKAEEVRGQDVHDSNVAA